MDNHFGTLIPKTSPPSTSFDHVLMAAGEVAVFQEYGMPFTNEPTAQFFNSSNFDFAVSSSVARHASMDNPRRTPDLLLPLARCQSLTDDDKESAKERRRTQNRFAQRAYRQRKEQAIKDQEKEIESLKTQLAKEKKLNQALARVIEFLKERLNSKQPK